MWRILEVDAKLVKRLLGVVHVDQSELANPRLLDHVVHQQLDRSGSNLAVDQGQLVHVIRNWVLKNRQQLLD